MYLISYFPVPGQPMVNEVLDDVYALHERLVALRAEPNMFEWDNGCYIPNMHDVVDRAIQGQFVSVFLKGYAAFAQITFINVR